jgi:hypothetical protein
MRGRWLGIVSLAMWAIAGVALAQTTPPPSTQAAPPATPPVAHVAPPETAQHATPPDSSHVAPGVSVQTHPLIEPQNALERAFVDAADNPASRAAFRREFLDSQVALAISSNAPDAPPAAIPVSQTLRAGLIFTSTARMTEVMGEQSPRAVITGREALERLRGGNVIININLRPYLVLDAAGISGFLDLPNDAAPATPTPAPTPPSSGPSQ